MTAPTERVGRHFTPDRDRPVPAADGSTAEAADTTQARGRITVADRVVAGLAAQVAAEQPDAGAPAGRLLGLPVPGSTVLGGREPDLASRPRVSASVDGAIARVDVTMSVRWPASVRAVTERVRTAIRERVGDLAGLDVVEVAIHVTGFATTDSSPTPARVR